MDYIDQMQNTMHHLYLEDISRNSGANGNIAGRGVAMAAETPAYIHSRKQEHCTPQLLENEGRNQYNY